MISAVMERLVSSIKYRISKIFRYDFYWGSHNITWVNVIKLFHVFIHNIQIQEWSYLIGSNNNFLIVRIDEISRNFWFNSLLMLVIYRSGYTITLFTLLIPIEIMICFSEESLAIILSLGLLFWFSLFMIFVMT